MEYDNGNENDSSENDHNSTTGDNNRNIKTK